MKLAKKCETKKMKMERRKKIEWPNLLSRGDQVGRDKAQLALFPQSTDGLTNIGAYTESDFRHKIKKNCKKKAVTEKIEGITTQTRVPTKKRERHNWKGIRENFSIGC